MLTTVTVLQKDLLESIKHAISFADKGRPLLPVLKYVLLTAEATRLTISSTNLNTYYSERIAASVVSPEGHPGVFRICADASGLKEAVEVLKPLKHEAGRIEFSISTRGALIARSGKNSLTIRSLPYEDFPALGVGDTPQRLGEISSRDIIAIATRLDTYAKEDSRPILCGYNIQSSGGNLVFAATDSYRLATYTPDPDSYTWDIDGEWNIPSDSLVKFSKTLDKKTPKTLSVIYSPRGTISFVDTDHEVIIFCLEGGFPNYAVILPKNDPEAVAVLQSDVLINAAKVVQVSARDGGKEGRISWSAAASESIRMTAKSGDGGSVSDTELEAVTTGNAGISINFFNFLGAMESLKANSIRLQFYGEKRVFIVSSDDVPGLVFLIMPMVPR